MSAPEFPTPSPRARELVRGGVDVHVHISPDVVERRIDDVTLARRCEEVGLAGFVVKSHYTSTAERASVVRAVVPGIAALGALVLNRAIGGMNPLAVEIAAREGARMVWMPTTDSHAEREHLAHQGPNANLPVWAKVQAELSERGHRERAGADARPERRARAGDEARARGDRRARARARHRSPRPRGGLRAGGGGARRGGRARGRDAPGLPRAGLLDRRAARAGREGRLARALLHHAPHRQVLLGAVDRGRPGRRSRAHDPVERPRASSPTRRSRTACR